MLSPDGFLRDELHLRWGLELSNGWKVIVPRLVSFLSKGGREACLLMERHTLPWVACCVDGGPLLRRYWRALA